MNEIKIYFPRDVYIFINLNFLTIMKINFRKLFFLTKIVKEIAQIISMFF